MARFWGDLRKYSGPMVEGLTFTTECYPWHKLPKDVFDTIGGVERAKELRRIYKPNYGSKSKVQEGDEMDVPEAATGNVDAIGENKVKEEGTSNKEFEDDSDDKVRAGEDTDVVDTNEEKGNLTHGNENDSTPSAESKKRKLDDSGDMGTGKCSRHEDGGINSPGDRKQPKLGVSSLEHQDKRILKFPKIVWADCV